MSLFKKKETNEDPVPGMGDDAMQQDDALCEETVRPTAAESPAVLKAPPAGHILPGAQLAPQATEGVPSASGHVFACSLDVGTAEAVAHYEPLVADSNEESAEQISMGNEPEKPSPTGKGDRVAVEGVQDFTDTTSTAEETPATEDTDNPSVCLTRQTAPFTQGSLREGDELAEKSLSPSLPCVKEGGPTQLVEGLSSPSSVPPVVAHDDSVPSAPIVAERPAELALSPAPAAAFDTVSDLSDAQLAAIHARVLHGEIIEM